MEIRTQYHAQPALERSGEFTEGCSRVDTSGNSTWNCNSQADSPAILATAGCLGTVADFPGPPWTEMEPFNWPLYLKRKQNNDSCGQN